ncbi:hypothetical protein C8R31_101376 [Nitrosospira sp. Nsp2]|nr:hypothetical protein [Nitrosospira sp. Nsp2]PTR17217.1 hypothetical protein C8R31_101376 [Nitrosospira sp. Nsp2]
MITREKPVHAGPGETKLKLKPRPEPKRGWASTPAVASARITHLERVIGPSTGFTKMDLVHYCGLVAPLMMEHLSGRPVSLVRAPDGITGQLFFQKHLEKYKMTGVIQLDQALDPGHPPFLEVATQEGLLAAAQMNVIEFHT